MHEVMDTHSNLLGDGTRTDDQNQVVRDGYRRVHTSISDQGSLVVIKAKHNGYRYTPTKVRGVIREYSRGSRMRFLRWTATVDWDKVPESQFLTLTYPDSSADVTMVKATSQRSHICRWIERRLECNTPCVWRKEYKSRSTGEYKDSMVHHWHLLVFTKIVIDECDLRREWMRELGTSQYTQVDSRMMDSGVGGVRYLAKYMQKPEGFVSLDNGAYLTKCGRPWGVTRKELVPIHAEHRRTDLSDELIDEICDRINGTYMVPYSEINSTVTCMGDRASEAMRIIREVLSLTVDGGNV